MTAKAQAIVSERRWQFLTSYGIKWVAIVTMLIDHLAAILVYAQYVKLFHAGAGTDARACYDVYLFMRHVGRIAFPLFCFLLTEGFAHTRSKPKYAWRLFLFALIAEWPYDWALYGTGIEFVEHQSVMLTLLVGFLALWGGERLGALIDGRLAAKRVAGAHAADPQGQASLSPATAACTVALVWAGAWLADVCEMSYHAFGVLLIGALYLGRGKPWLQFVLGCVLVGWYCWDHGSAFEAYAVIGLALIFLYNGKRGRSMKWFFYLFYPCHLLVIGLLKLWLF